MECPVCREWVPHSLLRVDMPRCSKGHELGVWVMCGNKATPHVYLRSRDSACPVCSEGGWSRIEKGTRVKCMNRTGDRECLSPYYVWMVDGPPCHLNHLTVISVVGENEAPEASAG